MGEIYDRTDKYSILEFSRKLLGKTLEEAVAPAIIEPRKGKGSLGQLVEPDDFPGYQDALLLQDPYEKVAKIEEEFAADIPDSRFIPYIQLHEFETLLFVEPEKFGIEYIDETKKERLRAVANEFGNPELINQGPETAPSRRIIKVFFDYENNKPAIGSMVAHEIGVDVLRRACRHFNEWLTKLERLA